MPTLTKHIGDTLQAGWSGISPRTSDLLTLRDAQGVIAFGPSEGIAGGAGVAVWTLTGGILAAGQTYASQRVITTADGQVQQAAGPDVAIVASAAGQSAAERKPIVTLLGVLTGTDGLPWAGAEVTFGAECTVRPRNASQDAVDAALLALGAAPLPLLFASPVPDTGARSSVWRKTATGADGAFLLAMPTPSALAYAQGARTNTDLDPARGGRFTVRFFGQLGGGPIFAFPLDESRIQPDGTLPIADALAQPLAL